MVPPAAPGVAVGVGAGSVTLFRSLGKGSPRRTGFQNPGEGISRIKERLDESRGQGGCVLSV